MKKLFAIFVTFIMVGSVASASSISVQKSVQKRVLSEYQKSVLFGNQQVEIVSVLNDEQMQNVEGKVWMNLFSGFVNGTFSAWGYSMKHPYDSTWSGFKNAFVGGFVGGFIAPSITVETGLSYFASGYFGSWW